MTMIRYTGNGMISLPVDNLDKSERWFCETLGFATIRKLAEPPWCEMQSPAGSLTIGLAEVDRVRIGDAMLTLSVEDVAAARQSLLDKKADVGDVVTVDGVARVVTLLDRDGNALMLREEL